MNSRYNNGSTHCYIESSFFSDTILHDSWELHHSSEFPCTLKSMVFFCEEWLVVSLTPRHVPNQTPFLPLELLCSKNESVSSRLVGCISHRCSCARRRQRLRCRCNDDVVVCDFHIGVGATEHSLAMVGICRDHGGCRCIKCVLRFSLQTTGRRTSSARGTEIRINLCPHKRKPSITRPV